LLQQTGIYFFIKKTTFDKTKKLKNEKYSNHLLYTSDYISIACPNIPGYGDDRK